MWLPSGIGSLTEANNNTNTRRLEREIRVMELQQCFEPQHFLGLRRLYCLVLLEAVVVSAGLLSCNLLCTLLSCLLRSHRYKSVCRIASRSVKTGIFSIAAGIRSSGLSCFHLL